MMPPEEFRRFGHEVVDWIADYLAGVGDLPVVAPVRPGALLDQLPAAAPERGEPMSAILDDFRSRIVPAVTHWNHPRFLAYFAVSSSGPGILGEMLAAALNVNGMLWLTSPAGVELEQLTMSWLRQWLGLPESYFGMIHDTASTSTLHALAAAREMADPESRTLGGSRRLTLYTSEQSHASVDKGAIALGIGRQNIRHIPVDESYRMRADLLAQAMERDAAAGRRPFCVVATVGQTPTANSDAIAPLADVAQRFGAWLHVDAAYAGSAAAVCPEWAHLLDGASRAHSLVTNPHKWLLTPIDCSALFTRHPEILQRAFQLVPDYLKTAGDPRAVNLMDYGVPLGRRFRALKLWFVMRYFGREGLAAVIRAHIALARELAAWIAAEPAFELAAPQALSVVCFRYRGSDEDNLRLLDAVHRSGQAFLSQTKLNGRVVLRLAIGNQHTTRDDIVAVWDLLRRLARS